MKVIFRSKAAAAVTYFSGFLAAIGAYNVIEHACQNNQAAFGSFMFSFVCVCVIIYMKMTGAITVEKK